MDKYILIRYQVLVSVCVPLMSVFSLSPDERRFCVFSLAASTDSREVLGGSVYLAFTPICWVYRLGLGYYDQYIEPYSPYHTIHLYYIPLHTIL